MPDSVRIFAASLYAVVFALLTGCADLFDEDTSKRNDDPGLYGLEYYGGDINGEIGHPLGVSQPRARCEPDHNWTADDRIISGTLPPGLTVQSNGSISGIPTERGHWIVKQEIYNIRCAGESWQGSVREIRFHITGSGKVVQ
jgi:hypothetical protein